MKNLFLLTAAEESHLLDLSSRIDGALHAEQGETPQDFAKRLMDKEAVTAALQAAGIDTAKEADFLKKKAAIPSFTVTMLIDNTAPADSRERLFLYTSKAPTTPAEIPQETAVIDKYKSIATLKRTAQGKTIAEIREALISCKGISLPADSSYLPFPLWDVFTTTWAIIGNVGETHVESFPSVGGKKINKSYVLLDRLNAGVWKMLEKDLKGQISFPVGANGATGINILYSINFDALKDNIQISKKLDAFDKRVYIAVAALYNAGNMYITTPQIYDALGHTENKDYYNPNKQKRRTNPGAADIKRIEASLKKMTSARIYIDTSQEAQVYNYARFFYEGSLLPYETYGTISINGQKTNRVILPLREPPLVDFARSRGQITTIDRKILSTPLRMTEQNLQLEDYLLERIAHAKKGNMSRKILFTTIYYEARLDGKQKQRALPKIITLLDYYKKCGHIVDYDILPDGVELKL